MKKRDKKITFFVTNFYLFCIYKHYQNTHLCELFAFA